MAAVSFTTATGTIQWRDVDEVNGASTGSVRFWFRRVGDMRIDGANGMVMLQTNGLTLTRDRSGKMQLHEGHVGWGGNGNPSEMLGGRDVAANLSNPSDFSTPQRAGVKAEIDGRLGWAFTLEPPPHKPHPLRVVIDDATGAIL